MNLIANSGLQFFTIPLEINKNDNFKMYFHEWEDKASNQLKLEIAHYFAEDMVWVPKMNLARLGYIVDGKVGYKDGNDSFKALKWEDIKERYVKEYAEITQIAYSNDTLNCFQLSLTTCNWAKFENTWLPLPFSD